MPTFRFAMTLLLALAAPLAFAVDALVKPVPVPDLSKLSPDRAADVRSARIAFEKDKAVTVGDDLAAVHAVLGAVAFTLLKELLSTHALVGPLADHWQLSLGLVIIVFVALLPKGLIGIAQRLSPQGAAR